MLAQFPLRLLEDFAEILRGEFQEAAVAAFECRRGLGPKRIGHLRLHDLDDLSLPLEASGGLGKPCLGLHGLDALVVEGFAQPRDFAFRLLELLPELVHLSFGVAGPTLQLGDPDGVTELDLFSLPEDFLLGGKPRDDPQQDPAASEAGQEDDHDVDGHEASLNRHWVLGVREYGNESFLIVLKPAACSLMPVFYHHLRNMAKISANDEPCRRATAPSVNRQGVSMLLG